MEKSFFYVHILILFSALNLIQNEDYLTDADIDELRFFKRHGDVSSSYHREKLNRTKQYSLSDARDEGLLSYFQVNFENGERRGRVKRGVCCCDFGTQNLVISFVTACNNANCGRTCDQCACPATNANDSQTTTTTTTPAPFLPSPEQIGTTVGVAAVLTLAMNPPPSNVPSNSPQPGSPGGGGLPSSNLGNYDFLRLL